MPNSNLSLLAGIETRMQHLAARQRVVAQNIANSETPGFTAQDVEAPDFGDMLRATTGAASQGQPGQVRRPQVIATAAMVQLGSSKSAGPSTIDDASSTEIKPDGNNVTLETQMLRVGEIQADFASVTNLYQKQIGFLKRSIGSRGL